MTLTPIHPRYKSITLRAAIAACLAVALGQQSSAQTVDSTILISADDQQYGANGDVKASGDVQVTHGERVIKTPEILFHAQERTLEVPGDVEVSDPQVHIKGSGASIDTQGDAKFTGTQFELPDRDGHGSAEIIRVQRSGELDMRGVSYTTCPNPNPAWQLRVGRLHIDAEQREGSATNARLEIKGIPVVPIPYISFPVGSDRKTGVLFPAGGDSSRSGTSVAVPWYWNIAPNYDATFKPTWYSLRGWDLGSEFRFLTEKHKGNLRGNYLPDDRQTHIDRSLFAINTQSNFMDNFRVSADAANASDPAYFEDLTDSSRTSTVVVPRDLLMQYQLEHWSIDALAQHHQIIDQLIPYAYRPYASVPRVGIHGYYPDRAFGLTTSLDAEVVAFRRNNDHVLDAPGSAQSSVATCRTDTQGNLFNAPGCQDYNGNRIDVMPEVRLPIRGATGYVEPAVAWRYTAYQLVDAQTTLPFKTAKRSLPIVSIDSGITFERITGNGARIQTFEPRLLYLYVPERNQDELPVFDTSRPDLTLIQLFSTHRYVGADRVGDANQAAYGFTSRLINRADGQQFLSATLGQTVRYSTPKVTLPGEIPGIYDRSDIVGEMALTAFKNWSAQAGLQWNPNQSRAERMEFTFQYRLDGERVINAGYRFRQPRSLANSSNIPEQPLEQVHASFAWPAGPQFSAFGRIVYSLRNQLKSGGTAQTSTSQSTRSGHAIDQFAGVEYRSCCWNMRLVAGRSLATREGQFDTWYKFQFELKGLSTVGNADAFLTQSIPGYSAARNSSPSIP
jgi:LPS-assembly protein